MWHAVFAPYIYIYIYMPESENITEEYDAVLSQPKHLVSWVQARVLAKDARVGVRYSNKLGTEARGAQDVK